MFTSLAPVEYDTHNHPNRLTTVIVSRFMFNLQAVKRRLSQPISTIGSQDASIQFRLGSLGAPLDCSLGGIREIRYDYEVEEEG